MEQLKPTDTMDALRGDIKARRSPMLHGDPGIGKTQMVWTVAAELFASVYGWSFVGGVLKDPKGKVYAFGYPKLPWFREMRTATMNPEDFGLPRFDDKTGRMTWAMSDILPEDERGGVFFLDEVNRGTESMVNSCFALVDRKLHDYVLPQKWVPVAAVNDRDIGARKMSSAFLARFNHLDVRTDLDDVVAVADTRDWHPAVAAFLKFRPDLLHAYDPKQRVSPNPRAWENVSNIVKEHPKSNVELALVAGDVGSGAACEFVSFIKMYRELPTFESIIANPKTAMVPKGTSSMWAVASMLSRRATSQTFDKVIAYLERIPLEMQAFGLKSAVRRDPSLPKASMAFVQWCTKHSELAN